MRLLYDPRLRDWTKEITCYSCRARFEINVQDLKFTKKMDSEYSPGDYYNAPACKCPVCDQLIAPSVPNEILRAAKLGGY